MRLATVAMLAMLAGGCYSPSFDGPGGFLCKNGQCPEGFTCSTAKRCLKNGAPNADADIGAPDSARDSRNEGPPPRLVCGSKRSVDVYVGKTAGQNIGLALDATRKVLWLSFIRAEGPGMRFVDTRRGDLATAAWVPGPLSLDNITVSSKTNFSAIAALGDKVALIYQGIVGTKQALLARTSASKGGAMTIATNDFAGNFPTVVFDSDKTFVIAHQFGTGTVLNPSTRAQLMRIDYNPFKLSAAFEIGVPGVKVSGYANRLTIDGKTIGLLTAGTSVKNTIYAFTTATDVASLGTLTLVSPSQPVEASGDISLRGGAVRLAFTFKQAKSIGVQYILAPENPVLVEPGVTRPAIGVEGDVVGIAAVDAFGKTIFKARVGKDDWTNALTLTAPLDKFTRVAVVASKTSGATRFDVLIKSSQRIVHHRVECK